MRGPFFMPKRKFWAFFYCNLVQGGVILSYKWRKVVENGTKWWHNDHRHGKSRGTSCRTKAGDCVMFMGEYNHTVDPKGRLIVPSKFREQLGDEFVVTKGLDGCLFVYTTEEWHNIEEKFRNISMTSKDARKFSRFFFAGAAAAVSWTSREESCFRRFCANMPNLTKDVVLVGVLSRVEIWDKDRWQENTYR